MKERLLEMLRSRLRFRLFPPLLVGALLIVAVPRCTQVKSPRTEAEQESNRLYVERIINPLKAAQSPVIFVRTGKLRCSAVAVGPHTLMTAAHCIRKRKVTIETSNEDIPSQFCRCHPAYGDRSEECKHTRKNQPNDADLALCFFTESFSNRLIQQISTDSELIKAGSTVTLAGYGCEDLCCYGDCTKWDYSTAQEGPTKISASPAQTEYLFFTEANFGLGESALCSGDSGGPVLATVANGRVVVGVGKASCVSKTGCFGKKQCPDKEKRRSAVAHLTAQDTEKWLCAWQCEDEIQRDINGLDCTCPAPGP